MSSKKSTTKSGVLSRILFDILGAIGGPVTLNDLWNVLLLLGHEGEFENFRQMSAEELGTLMAPLLASGEVRQSSPERLLSRPWSSEELRALFARPEYSALPEAISRALPMVDTLGNPNADNLQRDIRNAFFSQNTALLNRVLLTMRESFPEEYAHSDRFDFLFDEPEEWLLGLSESFLKVCAWRLLPSAMMSLRPVRPLAEKFYRLADNAQPMAIAAMLDYALLCGDWSAVPALMRRLPQGRAPRLLRLAWIRFVSGRDDESIGYFRDALDIVRSDAHAHDSYFRTTGGIFGILALLREGSASSLHLAQLYAKAGLADDTPHGEIYTLLEQVVRAKANPDLPPFHPVWHTDSRLNNFFACVAHFWLTGTLDGGQKLLLENAASAAKDGGYNWLYEECQELLRRIRENNGIGRRWHDDANEKLPYLLDCVLTRNSWVDRMHKLGNILDEMPTCMPTRLAWFLNTDQMEKGILTVKPIEQHATKSGRWTKGRRYVGYRDRNFHSILPEGEGTLAEEYFTIDLSPQDKLACDILRDAEELLKTQPDMAGVAWGRVLQALVGHPRLFMEGGDGQPVHCVPGSPVIRVNHVEGALQYSLMPEVPDGWDCVPRLERGDQLCIYQYTPALRRLCGILSKDFRVPDPASPENRKILSRLVKSFRVVSDEHLEALEAPVRATDLTPCFQLTPRERGLHVELMLRPFGTGMPYYEPGEGPKELIFQEKDSPVRMVRDTEEEIRNAGEIVSECLRLNATPQEKSWQWNLEGLSCYELTLQLREMLDKCHVQWPADQRFVCHRTLSMSNVSLHTQSYLSWFSVDGEVKLEDTDATLALSELIQAAAERKHFVSLSDGQVVALSESLRKRLEDLSRLGEIVRGRGEGGASGSLRVCQFLMPFLLESLSEFPGAELPPEANQWIKKYNDAMATKPAVPKELQATLRPYQEEGYLWMSRLDAAKAGACLADDMGLGKTVQAIALILSRSKEGPALVVAPTSVCPNWASEFQKFAPGLVCEVFGAGDREETFRRLGPRHVLISSYGLLQSEQKAFRKIQWRIAVLDEAQAIKNAHAKRSQAALEIHADFRIVTTGTPVENNLSELWSIFNFIIPGLLGSRENFQHRFASAIEHDNNTDVLQNLRGIVSPFLLRRRKDQVLNELPPKEEIDYPVSLSPEERSFYDDLRKRILADLDSHEESEGQRHIRVLAGITKLRLAVDHPRLVQGGEKLSGTKLEAFLELLRRILQNGHKVLVFSQFVKFLEIVRETLDGEGIHYEYLDGARTSKERASAVRNFQNGDVPVFLISLKAGGLGLNLTQADYVIHLDSWWNPAVENQASDRAHRLGQNKKVTIYHLQTVNTIEDKIKALHKRKRDLADNLLSDADTIETTPLEELLRLIREN